MNLTKSWKKPTPEQVKKTLALLVHPHHRDYFFNRLENPEWIEELRKQEWFKYPPPVIQIENNTVSFPRWAESRYLARMAVYKPEEVLAIAKKIETDNPIIHIDFVKAALAMPPDIAADLKNQIKRWISLPYSCDSLADQVGELISHLAKGEQIKAALKLVIELLAVFPDPLGNQHQRTDISYRPPLHPRGRFNEWHYNRILKKNIPDLVVAAHEKALPPLCGLLQDAIKLSSRLSDQQEESNPIWEDNSNNWRSSIEDDSVNLEFQDIKNSLVTTIRDSAQQIIAADSSKLRGIILLLRKCRWRVFHRLAIHLLRQFPKVELSLVAETLIDHNYFDYPRFHQDYEYALLAHDQFVSLSIHDQKVILDWIDNPVLEQSSKHDTEESLYWIKRWQVRKLTPLKSNLSDEWQQRYAELVNDVGSFKLTDLLPALPQERFGSKSPKNVAELAAMEIEELIDFLKNWEPSQEGFSEIIYSFDQPSSEGLAWSLQQIIEAEPLRYAAVADQFRGLSPRYVTRVFWGLGKILNSKQTFEESLLFSWLPILNLCQWCVKESHSTRTNKTASQIFNSEWREPRLAIISTLEAGLSAKDKFVIPLTLREELWAILEPLTSDPDPTPDYEMKHRNSDDDVGVNSLSINTVRGKAIHAVIRYALWLRSFQEQSSGCVTSVLKGFDDMPEVQKVLEDHLDVNIDPSLAVRSIYGQWLPWLVMLDENWVIQNIPIIFPADRSLEEFRKATWNSYIVSGSFYDNVFKLLVEEYRYAIDQLRSVSKTKLSQHTANPRVGLVRHLMVFYWRGQISLDNSSLIAQFYNEAPVFLRREAMEFIGRSLKNTRETIDTDIKRRLTDLWESRLSKIQESTDDSNNIELVPYGWWFSSGKFDTTWAINQLKIVLEKVNKIDVDYSVVEQLSKLGNTYLEPILECLQILIEKDKTDYGVHSWEEEAYTILTMAFQSGNTKIQNTAKSIIDLLGRKGYWKFRELLS